MAIACYGINFGDPLDGAVRSVKEIKHHPSHCQLTSYAPGNNTLLIEFTKIVANYTSADGPASFLSSDTRVKVILFIPELDMKDLANASLINKYFYIATKADIIWETFLRRSFPKVKCIGSEETKFTPEQQYKIIFRGFQNDQYPYVVQSRLNDRALQTLVSKGANAQNAERLGSISLFNNGSDLKLAFLVGRHYDGTPRSIDPKSQFARCNHAIRVIEEKWNNQEKFAKCIEDARTINIPEQSTNSTPAPSILQLLPPIKNLETCIVS